LLPITATDSTTDHEGFGGLNMLRAVTDEPDHSPFEIALGQTGDDALLRGSVISRVLRSFAYP
jgi:hypothetical protein